PESTAAAYITQSYLSNLEVQAFAQDDAGYMWIATQGGLYRYNGYDFRYYYSDPQDSMALSSSHVYDLRFDPADGCLWIANENVLVRLSTADNTVVKYPSPFGMAHYGLLERDGLLVAYGSSGVTVLDKREGLSRHVYDPGRFVKAAAFDSGGGLWLGMEETGILLRLAPDFTESAHVVLPRTTTFTCCRSFDDGNIWFGTRQGLTVLDAANNRLVELPLAGSARDTLDGLDITTIELISGNTVLIGTLDRGIYLYDTEDRTLVHSSATTHFGDLRSPYIRGSFTDRAGNVWVGTSNSGFHLEATYRRQFNPDGRLTDLVADRLVKGVAEDGAGRLWIVARYGGMVCYDPAARSAVPYRGGRFVGAGSPLLRDVRAVFCDSSDRLWCGYPWGYAVFDVEREGLVLRLTETRQSEVVCFEEDVLGRVWIGTDRDGVTILSRDLEKERDYAPRDLVRSNVTRILRLSTGMMLVASFADNVFIVDPVSMRETRLASDGELSDRLRTAVTLFEDSRGNIWIGTYNNGLLRFDTADKSLRGFSMGSGLPSNDVVSIEEDSDGRLWMGTSNGISLFDPEADRFVNFYVNDGTGGDQYYEKAVYKARDGRIYFGAIHGLTHFVPSEIRHDHVPLTVVLDKLSIFKRSQEPGERRTRPLPPGGEVRLRSSDNMFSIEFSALEYNSPEKIDYAYMLEGFDSEWNYVGKQCRATYSRVPPGHYTFRVRASNGNNIWGDASTAIGLSIIPSFWQTGWAKFLYVLITVGVVYLISRFYIGLKLSKEKMIFAEREYEKEKTLSDMRIKFFTNISHELKTPLTLIYSPINELLHDGGVNDPRKTLYYLSLVQNNVSRLIRLIDQLLDFERLDNDTLSLKVAQCDIVPRLKTVTEGFCYYADEKNIRMHIDCPYDSLSLPVDADKLEKILINLISNALKYTPDNGNIWIEARATRYPDPSFRVEQTNIQYLQINVIDDGIGIPGEDLPMLFDRYRRFENRKSGGLSGTGIGLYYVKRLVEVHGGQIYARNRPQGGMVFCFIIPLEVANCEIVPNQSRGNIEIAPGIVPLREYEGETVSGAGNGGEPGADRPENRVLVVDDNTELRLFLKSAMQGRYDVVVAADGIEGYRKAEELVPDIVISDVMMPGRDGLDLCNCLKNNVDTSHIPVVLLTAKSEINDQIKGYAQGADMYIAKPFEVKLLFSIIDNLLLKHKRQKDQILQTTPVQTLAGVENLSPLDRKFLEKFYAFIEENLSDENLNVNVLSRNLDLSRTSLYRKIKALTGKSPNDFLRIYRLNRSAELIREGELMLNEIAERTGFGTHSHFSTCFKKQFGVSPRDFV
ncbi:MAG: response regulator, partial [Rikenellaceae bacterium]|nr:response regulator [Rikenellaceae bacterium]